LGKSAEHIPANIVEQSEVSEIGRRDKAYFGDFQLWAISLVVAVFIADAANDRKPAGFQDLFGRKIPFDFLFLKARHSKLSLLRCYP